MSWAKPSEELVASAAQGGDCMANSDNKKSIPMASGLANKGRCAGYAVLHDDYSENSGRRKYYKSGWPRFPHDNVDPESLNGECIIVQEGRKKDGK